MITTDGGESWESHPIDATGDYKVLQLQVIDELTLFIRLHISQGYEQVLGSTDGGESWSELSGTTNLEDVETMYWLDEERGLLFGTDGSTRESHLLQTTDRGQSWTTLLVPSNGPLNEKSILDMAFIDGQRGFAVGQGGTILTTSNSGSTWELANQGYPMFYSIGFLTDDRGFLSTGLGYYESSDGGSTWDYSAGTESIYAVDMSVGPQGVYLSGVQGLFSRLDPDTKTVDPIPLPVTFYWLYYMGQSPDALFLAGTTLLPEQFNAFLISDDGGERFDVYEIDAGDNGLMAIDHRSGVFFATTSGELLISTDRGATWTSRYTFAPGDYPGDAEFFDDSTGIVVLTGGRLLRTEDQGASFSVIDEEPRNITGLLAIDDQTMFAYGQRETDYGWVGAVWKSIDRGLTWELDPLPVRVEANLTSMCTSENYIFATGGNGEILRLRKPSK
jgi:photosystem II stability/assembly factor-like uncharacterized protein